MSARNFFSKSWNAKMHLDLKKMRNGAQQASDIMLLQALLFVSPSSRRIMHASKRGTALIKEEPKSLDCILASQTTGFTLLSPRNLCLSADTNNSWELLLSQFPQALTSLLGCVSETKQDVLVDHQPSLSTSKVMHRYRTKSVAPNVYLFTDWHTI